MMPTRAEWLKAVVRDGRKLLQEIDGTRLVDPDVREAAALLVAILNQDVTEGEDDEPQLTQTVGSERILSTEDPEMRHGRKSRIKRFDGYKVHVAEDLQTELITDIEVTPGNVHDGGPVEDMLTDSAVRLGAVPKEILGDGQYGSMDLRVNLAKLGIEVVAKLPGGACRKGERFGKADFMIDLEANAVTCPAGHRTTNFYECRDAKERPIRHYQFSAKWCNACALKERCTRAVTGRKIGLHYHEAILQAAQAKTRTEAFKNKYRRRTLVERKLAELLWRHDLRFGRFTGTRKTRLQALWTAAVVNLKRLGKLLEQAFESPKEAILRAAA